MEKLRIFIDSNINKIKYLDKLDRLPFNMHYFYPDIDNYHLKRDHEEKAIKYILENRKKNFILGYNLKHHLRQIISSEVFKNRYYIVIRPDQTDFFGQTFTNNGPFKSYDLIKIQHTKEFIQKYKEIENILKKIYPYWKNHVKDLKVLVTILIADRTYNGIKLLNDQKRYDINLGNWEDNEKFEVYNSNGTKYFVTMDSKGFFENKTVIKIHSRFPNLRIYNLDDFLEEFQRFS